MKMGIVAGLVTGSIGAIAAITGAFATVRQLPENYVGQIVEVRIGPLRMAFEGTSGAVRDLQAENAEGKLEANRDAFVKWEVELRKTNDLETRIVIQKQMRDLEATRGKLEQQLKTLHEIRRNIATKSSN